MAMMYMDSKFKNYQEKVIQAAKDAYKKNPVTCSVAVVAQVRFGTRRRKDITNAGKLECDAFNDIIYEDDAQITFYQIEKEYCKETPGATITIYEDLEPGW